MSEALRMIEPIAAPGPESPPAAAPEGALAVLPIEVNDNDTGPLHRRGETIGFEIPRAFWGVMIGCYTVLLAALLAATGGADAAFVIAISGFYVAMFFGTTRALIRQGPQQPRSPLARTGGTLATLYGPLGAKEVAAQMLVVPGLLACFGIAVVVIRACVF